MNPLTHAIQLVITDDQRSLFARAAGCARFAYNWALARWNELYRTGGKPRWTSLLTEFVALRDQQFPFMREVPSTAYYQPFRHLNDGFRRFLRKQGRHPVFKRKGHCVESFKVKILAMDDRSVTLERIGRVLLAEGPRFPHPHRALATITASADRWTIAILFDLPEAAYRIDHTAEAIVGIDLGLTSFATCSDGTCHRAPKPLRRSRRRLRRRVRRLSHRQRGSHRRERARLGLARLHRRIRHQRLGYLHPLTTRLVRENQTLVIENLSVRGMMSNHTLAKAISDVGWHEFRRQLTYKCVRYGRTLLMANRFYASSKICSRCRGINEAIRLSDRLFKCPHCGLQLDRDVNAAINLRTLAFRETNARGEHTALVLKGVLQVQPARGNANPGLGKPKGEIGVFQSPVSGV